jgi:hypothetical protein
MMSELTTTEVIQNTHREIMQFLHKQQTGDACAHELFRRAIALRDEQAWVGIYELYHVVVGSWILRQVPTLQSNDLAVLVNEVFAKFSWSISPRKLRDFPCVQALLAYLKRCAGSVVADYRRSCLARAQEEPMESVTQEPMLDDFAASVVDQLAAQEVWAVLSCAVTAHEERLILVLVCALGLAPRELQQRYPDLYASVQDIYRIKRSVLERLRRNKALHGLVDCQSPSQRREVRYAS